MKINKILKDISRLELGESTCFKLTDDRFLYVINWSDHDGNWFTTLELNDGEEIEGAYELYEVLEIVTLDYDNMKDIKDGVKFMLSCCKRNWFLNLFKL